jgi:hypothetical protein
MTRFQNILEVNEIFRCGSLIIAPILPVQGARLLRSRHLDYGFKSLTADLVFMNLSS